MGLSRLPQRSMRWASAGLKLESSWRNLDPCTVGLKYSMLTLFAIPKHSRGHFATIQRNAITSWTRLLPRPEILLFGNEEGTAGLARDLGVRHIPEVARNEFGTPLLHDLFLQAEHRASTPLVGYVNADIVLTDDFCAAVDRTRTQFERFMMVCRRWDLG